MKCKCGNETFSAHQVCHHDIFVDGSGEYAKEHAIYYSGKPFGPFTCIKCGTVYRVCQSAIL